MSISSIQTITFQLLFLVLHTEMRKIHIQKYIEVYIHHIYSASISVIYCKTIYKVNFFYQLGESIFQLLSHLLGFTNVSNSKKVPCIYFLKNSNHLSQDFSSVK